MFLVTFLVLNTADNPRQLDNNVFQASSIAQKYNCQLTRLDFQQEEGLMSALPLGLNQIEIQRGLTTSSTAIFVPFTTQELFQNGKEALYYGINALSNNLIMVDRKLLKNPNGLILGTPGSGKSFSAKREIANCFLLTNDDIIICDPEAEYAPLVERLHGQVIKISPTSTNYINPMDLNLDYSDDESPLSLKSDFILSLCELIVGGKEGLQPVQKTIIDRCVRLVYQTYLNDPRPENMPILEDLYNLLRTQEEKEAQYIATALEIYVTGSLNVFNHQSNVDINIGYIASWSKDKELKELRASLETINKTSCELINDIERHYKEICKERGIDLTAAPEPEQATRQVAEEVSQPSAEYREALLVLDDSTYLHVQPCDTGWDYTLYDMATMKQMDGGQLDGSDMGRSAAVSHICEDLGMGGKSIKYAPLSMIETLQEAVYQQMQERVSQQTAEAAAAQLPDAQELALDEYPMPDPVLTQDDLEKCGCLDSDLLPLSKERAYELMERDLTVYIIQEGENPVMAFDTADLDAHDGIFALPREEWQESPEFDKLVKDRMAHQEEREQAFLSHKGDCFAIYQVKHTDELRDIRYEGLEWLQSIGRTVQRDNYELVYTAPLLPSDLKGDTAEQLFYRFNNEDPADYRHPSMSVSDIVAVKRDGKISCHYCDSVGFEQVPGFLPDNPLKNAEMAVEDDYGMIDGIINNGPKEPTVAQLEQQARSGQPISLIDLAATTHREDREKKKSVMEQLKSQPKAEHKKTAPKKSAEREI